MTPLRLWLPLALLLAACSSQGGGDEGGGGAPAAPRVVGQSGAQPADHTAAPRAKVDPGLAALTRNCSACHAPPRAKRHTAAEWPQVVARMELHRVQRAMGPIPPADKKALLAWLVRGAKKQ
ncbi:MAG: hypothetical protein D6682_08410 [Zetaproteobacteria bacterium]|nr:MAG: hypothetical protein D6682_08410 [Zetaproteobacteria bacterium]